MKIEIADFSPKAENSRSTEILYVGTPDFIPDTTVSLARLLDAPSQIPIIYATLCDQYMDLIRTIKRAAPDQDLCLFSIGQQDATFEQLDLLDDPLYEALQTEIAGIPRFNFPVPTQGLRRTITPKDLVTQIGEHTFVAPSLAEEIMGFEDTGFIASHLGEGGMLLHENGIVLLSDMFNDPLTTEHVGLLEETGQKVGYLPQGNPEDFPESMRCYPEGHIDHFSFLSMVGDQHKLYLPSTYYENHQSAITEIQGSLGLSVEIISDNNLPAQAFNVRKLPNGNLVCIGVDKNGNSSNLFIEALTKNFGDKVFATGDTNFLTSVMRAGPSCFTNPLSFRFTL